MFRERLLAAIKAPLESFVTPQSSFNLLFVAMTLLFCAAIYALHARRPLRLRTLRRFLLPRRIFLRASAKPGYKYCVVAAALRSGMLGGMVITSSTHDRGSKKRGLLTAEQHLRSSRPHRLYLPASHRRSFSV